MHFGCKYAYLGNDLEDQEEVKIDEYKDIVLSDSDVSDDDGETCLLNIFDTAGQEEYSSLRDKYVKKGDGFVIIYSITDRGSFTEAEAIFKWLKRLEEEESKCILVANKQDLTAGVVVNQAEGKDLATRLNIPFYETSAKTGQGVNDAMHGLVRMVPRTGSDYKIVMLGSGAVGKSSITLRFVNDTFVSDYDPTIEYSYRKKVTVTGLTAVSKDVKKAKKKNKRKNRSSNSSVYHRFSDAPQSPVKRRSTHGIATADLWSPSSPVSPSSPLQSSNSDVPQSPSKRITNIRDLTKAFGPPSPCSPPSTPKQNSLTDDDDVFENLGDPPPLPPKSPALRHQHVKKVKQQKADGNVVMIELGSLAEDPKLVTGDAIKCGKCPAVLTSTSTLATDGDKQIWNCEFCGHANCDLELDDDEIPKGDCLDYMLSPATKPKEDEKTEEATSETTPGVIIYCVDVSSSMQLHCHVPESHRAWREERTYYNETVDHVTRLDCIRKAVERLSEQLKEEQPDKQILLCTFSSSFCVIAGGPADKHPRYDYLKTKTFDQLLEMGLTLSNEYPLKPLAESYDNIVKEVKALKTTIYTALGPALAICTGYVSKIPSSEIVLCTDGEPNFGIGALLNGRQLRGADGDRQFYQMIGNYARSKNITINILAVEGNSTSLQSVSAAAEKSGGTTNKLNPMEIVRQLRTIAQNEIIASFVTVQLLLHPEFVFDEPPHGENLSQLEKEVGVAHKESDLSFCYKLRDPDKKPSLDKVPFQNIDVSVLGMTTMKKTAKLAQAGRSKEAQAMLKNVKRLVHRGAVSDQQREERMAFEDEVESLDAELTDNNYAYATSWQSDSSTCIIHQALSQNLEPLQTTSKKLDKIREKRKGPTCREVYYKYKDDY